MALRELLKKNANRCLALVVAEIAVISLFHYIEGELFLASELWAMGLHLLLSLFGLCFFVMMRSRLGLAQYVWYDIRRIIGDPLLYIVFDFLLIHASMGRIMGEFSLHTEELFALIGVVYGINIYFDTHKHHCCHDHCG